MSKQYSWITEDESGWDDEVLTQQPETPHRAARRWGQVAALAVVLLCAVGVLFWQVERRVDTATAAVATDIQSSYTLLGRAVANQDAELLNLVMSSRDATWTAVQQRLLTEGLLFDRHPIGIEAQAAVPELVAIEPSPDLTAAEVTVAGQYVRDGMAPVTLQQSLIFQRGERNWELSPPGSDFWGAWQTEQGRFVTLEYRERESAVAGRLLADLDAQVALMCTTLADIDCPADVMLLVRLDSDPITLVPAADSYAALFGSDRIRVELPTPSLIGVPVDEAGYQVLLQSYTRPVVAAGIAQAVGWECCDGALFYRALLDYQLSELGLQRWPLTPVEYETMFVNSVVNMEQLARYWAATDAEVGWRQAYSVVAYLLDSGPSLSAATMQRQLVAADDYWRWMDSLLPGVSADAAQQAWIRHAQARLAPSDLALPAQDILLVCEATDGERTSLYRYDVQAAAWGTEIENHIFMSVGAVPDGNGDLVLDRLRQMRQTRALLGGAENAERLLTQPMTGDLFRIGTAGLGLLVYAHDAFEPFTSFQRLETAACADGQCETTGVLIGRPVWSPDGTRTLIAAQDGTVWLGDDRGRLLQPVGVGAAPFWLDNDSYGFLRPDGEQTQALTEIAVATVATHAPETWLRMETLAAEISAETDPSRFTINTAVASTDNPDLLFVAVSTVNYENAYVFVVNRLTGEAQLQAATDYSFNRYTPFGASPEARWVTMNAFDRRSAAWQLHLIDSRTGDTQTLTSAYPFSVRSYDWSPDDQWLMRIQDGYLHLLAPDAGDQMILNHPYSGCLFAAWAES